MVKDFPVFGSGFGTFGEAYLPYRTFEMAGYMKAYHAHNDPLQLLVEGGLLGLAIVLTACGALFLSSWRGLQKRRDREVIYLGYGGLAGLTAFIFHSLTTFNFRIPANMLAFALLAALTLAAVGSRLRT
jgi:O-antigen ligase